MHVSFTHGLALVVALSSGFAHAEGAKEAQALFETMAAKVGAAKTVKVGFDCVAGPEDRQLKLKGELLLGGGKLAHFSVKGTESSGDEIHMSLTTDGTTLRMVEGEAGHSQSMDMPLQEGVIELMHSALINASPTMPLMLLSGGGPGAEFAPSNFSLLEKERDGDRTLQVLEYDVTSQGESFRVTLWIDSVTGLPAKRNLVRDGKNLSETYTAFELNPDLPASTFELGEAKSENADEEPTSRPGK